MKQVPKEIDEEKLETVELRPLSETDEDMAPKAPTDRKPAQPEKVETTPQEIPEHDQDKPDKPDKKPKKKRKTKRKETPNELPRPEEVELSSADEQVRFSSSLLSVLHCLLHRIYSLE